MARYEIEEAGAKVLAALAGPPENPESVQAASVLLLDAIEQMFADRVEALPKWLVVRRMSRFKLQVGDVTIFVRMKSRRIAVNREFVFHGPTTPKPKMPKEPNLVFDPATGLWQVASRSRARGITSAVEAVVDVVLPFLLEMAESPPEDPPPRRTVVVSQFRRANGPVGASRGDQSAEENPAKEETNIPNN